MFFFFFLMHRKRKKAKYKTNNNAAHVASTWGDTYFSAPLPCWSPPCSERCKPHRWWEWQRHRLRGELSVLLSTQLDYIKIPGEGTSAAFPSMVLLYNYAEAKTTLDSRGKRRNSMLAVSRSSFSSVQFSSVQLLSRVRLLATPWIAARQASLSIATSRSSLRFMSIESVMPSSHLILCRPLLLLPPIPPSIKVFSNESALHVRWPKYWSFSFSIIPSKEIPGLISFRMDLATFKITLVIPNADSCWCMAKTLTIL